jgi:hypothetical protein
MKIERLVEEMCKRAANESSGEYYPKDFDVELFPEMLDAQGLIVAPSTLRAEAGKSVYTISLPQLIKEVSMKEAILTIVKEVSTEASEWVANDGGLTIAASDILDQCSVIRNRLAHLNFIDFSRWFKKWVGGWDGALSCSTNLEAELIQGTWWVLDDSSDDDRLIRCEKCGTLYGFAHYDGECPDCKNTVD